MAFELQRSGTTKAVNPRDFTGRAKARLDAEKAQREAAEEIARIRASGQPGADQTMSIATAEAYAQEFEYAEGQTIGVNHRNQRIYWSDGLVMVDPRVSVNPVRS